DAQELKNARDSAEVVETAFCTFVLSRIAGEIASILDGIPLSVQRRFPELENRHVDFLKRDIIKAMNKAAALDELIPNFTRGNARADDLVRNNGYAANAIQLHQDHIVGSFFRLSHRPSWRYLGIGEEEARAFSREVEAAWKEFAEDDCCCIDVERKRTFTMMIREGVAMHAFNGELFVQATWDTSPSRLFRTQFRMVSPKRISNPNNTGDSRNCRAGVQINDSGAALGYYVSEDG
ncbi:phage portal protein, lambda family, partial [Escherichia coli TA144]